MPEGYRWEDADRLFEQALDLAPDNRDRWLDQACAGKPRLRAQVEALLRADAAATRFLELDALRLNDQVAVDLLRRALADRYRIDRELGQGGMATVYLARDLRHDRPVALKVLRRDLAAPLLPERFQREIRVAAGLEHPHILPVLDSGTARRDASDEVGGSEILWFTMPYVEGESLRERLRRERRLQLGEALRIAGDVAGALDYAHRQGLVHRDVKPENILLGRDDDTLVADFGIAKTSERGTGPGGPDVRLTVTGIVLGTPAYMSPEQAAGREVDGRSDIYSLGVVLYEMLTGERPFTGGSGFAGLVRQLTTPPLSLAERGVAVSPALESAVSRMLARHPGERYATAGEVAAVLAAAAGPPSRCFPA